MINHPIKAIFLDLSGVVYEDSHAINGAAQSIENLRQAGYMLRFVTNTATKSSKSIIQQLNSFNIRINADELFTAPLAAYQYLSERKLRPFCLIDKKIEPLFACLKQSDPNCVLIGDAQDKMTYANLNLAFQLCQQGYPLVAIGKSKYFKSDERLMLDSGAFVHALEWASGQSAVITGKPASEFYRQVVASTPYQNQNCLMIGDDVSSDVQGALDAGLYAILVQTGKYQNGDENTITGKAQLLKSVTELADYLAQSDLAIDRGN